MAFRADQFDEDRRRFRPAAPPRLPGASGSLAQRPSLAFVLSIAMVAVLGAVDILTGPDLAFSVFYLIPVSLLAWTNGVGLGVGLSALAAATWLLADAVAGGDYSSPFVPAWNTISRFVVFAAFSVLLTKLHRSLEQERVLARTDPLTGVRNVRSFHSAAGPALQHNRDARVMFMYLDLDDFKAINHSIGHRGGDEVLQRVGSELSASTRDGDIVGRLGGDEFAIVSLFGDDTDPERHAASMLVRLAVVLGELDPPVSFSAGAAWASSAVSLDTIIEAADDLMYEVKASGKGTFLCRQTMAVDV